MAKRKDALGKDDWLKVRETWFGMGPDRDLRTLQRFIQREYGHRYDLQILNAELIRRDLYLEALAFDRRIAEKVDAATTNTLVEHLASARLQGMRSVSDRANKLGDLLDTYLERTLRSINARSFSSADLTAIVNAYAKLEKMRQDYNAPIITDDFVGDDESTHVTPQDLARALLKFGGGRPITIEDLHDGKTIDVTPEKV